jgi:hypothetical protein
LNALGLPAFIFTTRQATPARNKINLGEFTAQLIFPSFDHHVACECRFFRFDEVYRLIAGGKVTIGFDFNVAVSLNPL